MAELEIGPEPRQFVGSTPSLPSGAPVQEELQRSAQQVDTTLRRASTLLLAINRQKQNETDANAEIELAKSKVKLDEQSSQITNPQQKMDFLTRGLNSAWEDIQKQYPGISSSAKKRAELQILNDHRTNFLAMVAEGHKQAIHDIGKKYDETKRLASMSTDFNHETALKFNFFNYLDQARDNGIISSTEADDYKVKIQRDINLERLASLAVNSPDQILQIDPKEAVSKYGVLPSDLFRYQTQAAQIIANGHNGALAQAKRLKNDNLAQAFKLYQQGDRAGIVQMWRNHQIPTDLAEQYTGEDLEKHPPNPGLVSHLEDMVHNIRAKNVDDFNDQYNKIRNYYFHDMNSEDKAEVEMTANGERSTMADNLREGRYEARTSTKDKLKDHASDNVEDLSNHIADVTTGDIMFAYSPSAMTKNTTDKIRAIQRWANSKMRGAPDEETQDQIKEKAISDIDKAKAEYNAKMSPSGKPASSTTKPATSTSPDLRSEAVPPGVPVDTTKP